MTNGMRASWEQFRDSQDAYRTVLLLLLVMIVLPIATGEDSVLQDPLLALVAVATVLLTLGSSGVPTWLQRTAWLSGLLAALVLFIPPLRDELGNIATLLLAVLMGFVPVSILRHIATHRRVTMKTVNGAISAYLAFGITFSLLYVAIYRVSPQSFVSVLDGGLSEFNYFSFVTMTTLGYGDITPSDDLSRALAIFQTIIGQIFLVVVVARVVGLLGTERPRHFGSES